MIDFLLSLLAVGLFLSIAFWASVAIGALADLITPTSKKYIPDDVHEYGDDEDDFMEYRITNNPSDTVQVLRQLQRHLPEALLRLSSQNPPNHV